MTSAKINIDSDNIEYAKLDNNDKVDESFDAGVDEFTEYYKFHARYDLQQGLAQTYFLKLDGRIIGYISIAMAHLRKENTPEMNAKGTAGNIPALLISHLATHVEFQRRGVATSLVDFAYEKAVESSQIMGCRYLMLNPRDDEGVRQFYINYGFEYISNLVDDKEKDAFILDIKQEKTKTD